MFLNKFNALGVCALVLSIATSLSAVNEAGGLSPKSFQACLDLISQCNSKQLELLGKRLPCPLDLSRLSPERKKNCTGPDVENLTTELEKLESPSKSPQAVKSTTLPPRILPKFPRFTDKQTLPRPVQIPNKSVDPSNTIELSPATSGHTIPSGYGVIYGHKKEGDTLQEGSIPKNDRANIKYELDRRSEVLTDANLNEYFLIAEIALLKAIQADNKVMLANHYIGETTNPHKRLSTAKIQGRENNTRQGIIVQSLTGQGIKRWMNILIEDIPKAYLKHFEILAGLTLNVFLRPSTYVSELGNKKSWERVRQYWNSPERKDALANEALDQVTDHLMKEIAVKDMLAVTDNNDQAQPVLDIVGKQEN